MRDIAWGAPVDGVRFGLVRVAAGAPLVLPLLVENRTAAPIFVFGWSEAYPRSLRVSPPKPHRPYVRVSFADTNVLHPPDAFMKVLSGQTLETTLDVSFALDLSVAGELDIAFVYEPVKAQVIKGWAPSASVEATTALVPLASGASGAV